MKKLSLVLAGLSVVAFSSAAFADTSPKPADDESLTHECPFGGHDKTAEKPKTS